MAAVVALCCAPCSAPATVGWLILNPFSLLFFATATCNTHTHTTHLQLCDLYENDCIFDKFDACMNGTASYVASGSYNNSFKVFKAADGSQGVPLEASRDPMRRRLQPVRVRAAAGAECADAQTLRFTARHNMLCLCSQLAW